MSELILPYKRHPSLDDASYSCMRDYIALLKPRVMSLVVFTGVVGIVLAPGSLHPFIAFMAVLSIALGSGAAGAVNMWYDRDIDALMKRTQSRPLPAGRMSAQNAIEFASFCCVVSVFIMVFAVNLMAAALLLSAILFYVFVYTMWLKRSTPQNIVIGGAAGAFPPVIGWAAVTGDVSWQSLLLFLIIFMWTPPHFWALSLYRCKEYSTAGIPMLPVVAGEKHTRLSIFVYTMMLVLISFIPFFIGMLGILYMIGASLLGGYFLYGTALLYMCYSEILARKMFKFSLLYLFLLFTLMMVDKVFFYALW